MIKILGAVNDNFAEAAREYARRYPERPRHPGALVFRRLEINLALHGRFATPLNALRPREQHAAAVLQHLEDNPHTSEFRAKHFFSPSN